jgi:hypothetical protein
MYIHQIICYYCSLQAHWRTGFVPKKALLIFQIPLKLNPQLQTKKKACLSVNNGRSTYNNIFIEFCFSESYMINTQALLCICTYTLTHKTAERNVASGISKHMWKVHHKMHEEMRIYCSSWIVTSALDGDNSWASRFAALFQVSAETAASLAGLYFLSFSQRSLKYSIWLPGTATEVLIAERNAGYSNHLRMCTVRTHETTREELNRLSWSLILESCNKMCRHIKIVGESGKL